MKALIVHNPKNYHPIRYGKVAKPLLQPLFFGWLTGIEIKSSPSSPLKPTVLIRTAHLANMTTTPIAYQTWGHARLGGQQSRFPRARCSRGRENGERDNLPRPRASTYHLLVSVLQNWDEASCCIFDSFLAVAVGSDWVRRASFTWTTRRFSRKSFSGRKQVLGL